MIRIRHRDKRTQWERANVRREDAADVILGIILKYRIEQLGINKASITAEVREVDPTGWTAVWVSKRGDTEIEEPIPIPKLPPLILS